MLEGNFLVTGGAGFIGSAIVNKLIKNNNKVIVIDDFSRGNKNNLNINDGNVEVIEGDVRDLKILRSAIKNIDYVIHAAARPQIKSLDDPKYDLEVNSLGTLNVLLAAKDSKVKKLLYTSTSSVYGELLDNNQKEQDRTNPTSPYATSKLAGEHYCKVYSNTYNLNITILRYFNVYGLRCNNMSKCNGVIPIFFNRVLEDHHPIIYGDGKQTRDFTYIDDVVRATLMIFEYNNSNINIFNVGTGVETTINDIALKIINMVNKSERLKPKYATPDLATKTGDINRRCANIHKVSKEIGWVPEYSIDNGLIDIYHKLIQG